SKNKPKYLDASMEGALEFTRIPQVFSLPAWSRVICMPLSPCTRGRGKCCRRWRKAAGLSPQYSGERGWGEGGEASAPHPHLSPPKQGRGEQIRQTLSRKRQRRPHDRGPRIGF